MTDNAERAALTWHLIVKLADDYEMELPVAAEVIETYRQDWDALYSDMSPEVYRLVPDGHVAEVVDYWVQSPYARSVQHNDGIVE